tara:strand:+ start:195 stop:440 length:246 start_codon:yes stop_codon:yes gene_type:complete
MANQNPNVPPVNLNDTTAIKTPGGKHIWQSGVILRQISKFIAGTEDDAVLPIPVFFDPETGKILSNGLPKELREEFKDESC